MVNKVLEFKNISLYQLSLKLTKKILELFNNAIIENEPLEYIVEPKWKKQDRFYIKSSTQVILWSLLFNRKNEEIKKLTEFIEFENELESVCIIREQLNTLVGTYMGSRRFDLNNILSLFVGEFLTDTTIEIFEQEKFDYIYQKVEDELYSDTIIYERITPLFGLSLEEHNVQIDHCNSLVKLSDKEILQILNLGVNLGVKLPTSDILIDIHRFAIKTTFRLNKIIGDKSGVDVESEKNNFINLDNEFKLVNALKVFKQGIVYPITTVRDTRSIFSMGNSFSFEVPIKSSSFEKLVLTNNETNEFIEFWNSRKSIFDLKNNFLHIAINRFCQSNERNSIEDRIVDLMIAAESLFLGSDGGNQGELKYKLSHRAAMFLKIEVGEQRKVFDFMNQAYTVRSKIVHGSNVKLPKKDGEFSYTLQEFCIELEELIRISIKKMITKSIKQDNKLKQVEWRDIIFPVMRL